MSNNERKSLASNFYSGLVGLGRIALIVAFAAGLSFLAGNLVVGIGLAAISMYIWMLQGEIDALHKRIKRLEASAAQQ